jgi:hypothetical protein
MFNLYCKLRVNKILVYQIWLLQNISQFTTVHSIFAEFTQWITFYN